MCVSSEPVINFDHSVNIINIILNILSTYRLSELRLIRFLLYLTVVVLLDFLVVGIYLHIYLACFR
jgi:hypothetical protein